MASSNNSSEKILESINQLFVNIDDPLEETFTSLNGLIKTLLMFPSKFKTATFSFAFDIILQNYLKLLNTDRFLNATAQDLVKVHREFLQTYYQLSLVLDIGNEQTNKTQREIFFFLFDQINSSKSIISYLQNNLPNDNKILINGCSTILYIILNSLNGLYYKLTNHDLDKYQTSLLNPLIEYIDQYFIRKENSIQHDMLIERIGSLFWNISHRTPIVPLLININCPQTCLRWLSLTYLDSFEYEFIICILCNIARHDEGGRLLSKLNCVQIVRQFRNETINTKADLIINSQLYINLCQISDLLLSLIIDLDELYLDEVSNRTIRKILSIGKECFEDSSRMITSEVLIVLMKFFTNDTIMYYILHHDLCPKFLTIILNNSSMGSEKNLYKFIEEEDEELRVLSINAIGNIFWSVSFDDQYKKSLIQNMSLIKKLETYPNDNMALYIHIPYQMSSLKRAMDGIFYNLYPSKSNPLNKQKGSLMISYSQVNINFCRDLYDMLSKLPELTINVDFKNGKYSWKEIAETIEQSDAVIFLLSKEFYSSKSCRQEFIHVTDRLKKTYFPIFIDLDSKPPGWIHKHVTRVKSIHFGDKDFLNTCEELVTLINNNLSLNISLANDFSDVTKWNDNEIKQWFIDHEIILELYEFYHFQNGNELLLYANAILEFPWIKEFDRVKVRFQNKQNLSQGQFLQFIHAFKAINETDLNLFC